MCGVRLLATIVASISSPALQHHAARASVFTRMLSTDALSPDLGALAARGIRDSVRDAAHAAAHESPQAAMAAHACPSRDAAGCRRCRASEGRRWRR